MYQTHFGMSRMPFRLMPDPDRYFPAAGHQMALEELQQAIVEGESLSLLEADPGIGKTLIGHLLLRSSSDGTRTVLLTNSHVDGPEGLIRTVLADLDVELGNDPRQCFMESCLDRFSCGGSTLVIADEAHHYTDQSLEEFRMWGNLEGPRGRAIQVILLALPILGERLSATESMAALRQRLSVRLKLMPITTEECLEMVTRELRQCGVCPETVLTREAGEVLAAQSSGVPRILLQLSNRAFRVAALNEARQVDVECVLEASTQLGLADEEPNPSVLRMQAEEAEPPEKPRTERQRRASKKRTATGSSS